MKSFKLLISTFGELLVLIIMLAGVILGWLVFLKLSFLLVELIF